MRLAILIVLLAWYGWVLLRVGAIGKDREPLTNGAAMAAMAVGGILGAGFVELYR